MTLTDRLQAHGRPEGETSRYERQTSLSGGLVHRGPEILHFPAPRIVPALGRPHAPEVEAQGGKPRARQGLDRPVDDLVMHRAAVQRVRMSEDGGSPTLPRRLLPEAFQRPRGPREGDGMEPA